MIPALNTQSRLDTRGISVNFRMLVRSMPITLIAVFAGTWLIILNPGLFWDDWVWFYQSPEANIQIGRELGVWWGGYLSNAIYASSDPVLLLRLTALLSWILGALAFAFVAARTLRLDVRESIEVFLLIAVCHVGLIRFLNSVALYNVYIAFFWLGAALLVHFINSARWRLVCLPFFFFSFYLNSFLVLYGAILGLLFLRHLGECSIQFERWLSVPDTWLGFVRHIKNSTREFIDATRKNMGGFVRQYALFLMMPFLFVAHKRLLTEQSELYGSYNQIHFSNILIAPLKAVKIFILMLSDYAQLLFTEFPVAWGLAAAGVVFLTTFFLPRTKGLLSWRQIATRLFLAFLLFCVSVYPYILVEKPPALRDFYESRHALIAIPPFIVFIQGLVQSLLKAFGEEKSYSWIFRNLLLSLLIGFSVAASNRVALDLWRDWYQQSAIMSFLSKEKKALSEVRLFLFADHVPMRIGARKVWNYEYTGNLVRVFGERSRFGISLSEFDGWPKAVTLITKKELKTRYNMADFKFEDGAPVAIVSTVMGDRLFDQRAAIELVRSFIKGKEAPRPEQFVKVSVAFMLTDSDERVREMHVLLDAIFLYRVEHGYFPVGVPPAVSTLAGELMPFHIARRVDVISAPPIIEGDIPGIFPDYAKRPVAMSPARGDAPRYFYISDGIDFKLVYFGASDFNYAKQAHPFLIDPVRAAYGFWTEGARNF